MKLDELEMLAKEATPGPWETDIAGEDTGWWGEGAGGCIIKTAAMDSGFASTSDDHLPSEQDFKNAAYIAAANPQMMQKLIALLREFAPWLEDMEI